MSDYNRDVLETYALERIKELKEDPESFNTSLLQTTGFLVLVVFKF